MSDQQNSLEDGYTLYNDILESNIHNERDRKKDLYVTSLDHRKYFTSVNQGKIGLMIQDRRSSEPFIKFIVRTYAKSKTVFKINNYSTEELNTARDLNLSPSCFA